MMVESAIQSSTGSVVDLAEKGMIRVLHVDDEAGLLNVAKECLEMEGSFRVDTASSVDEAAQKMKKETFDVVVCDYLMPDKDGLEFLKELRESRNEIPFIVFTGKGREEIAIAALNYGADLYLNKSGDPQTVFAELAHSIRQTVEKRRIERKLRDSEEKYRDLFELAPDAIVLLNMEGVITSCNVATLDITGYSRDEIVGKYFSELGFLRSNDIPRYMKLLDSISAEELPGPFEATWNHKDGNPFVAEFHVGVIKKDGRTTGIQVMARDITERIKAEEILHESEELFRSIVENSHDAIFILDDKFRIVYANDETESIVGCPKEEIVGQDFRKFVGTENLPLVDIYTRRQNGEKVPSRYQCDITGTDGRMRIVEVRSTILRDRQGRVKTVGQLLDITEQKKTEDRLRREKNKFEALFNLMADPVVIVDDKGKILAISDKVTQITGYGKEELVGKNFFTKTSIVTTKIKAALMENLSNRMMGKDISPYEVEVVTKDGRKLPFEINATKIEYDGKPADLVVARNLEERKRTEKKIRENQEKFERLFRDNPEAAVYVDADFHILDINPRFTELFGYSSVEVRNKKLLDLIVPEDKIEEAKTLAERAGSGLVYESDTIRKKKDGTIISVSISAAPITVEGQRVGYMGLYRNITKQKRAEEQLEESRKHFRTLFNLMVDPVAIVDKRGKILEVTRKAEEITGFKREELVGKNFLRTKIATAKSKAIMMKNLAERMMGKHMAPYEIEILTKDGRKLPYEINAAKIEYKGIPADMVVFRDVSERKKMEEKLRVVGELTRHDVRNKLSAITGNVYLAKKRLSGDSEATEFLAGIESACRRVERIFDFARTYERLGIEELSYVDVAKTIREATSLFSDLQGIKVVNDCSRLAVFADSLLRQIFYNLIDNSIKYGQKISQIRIFFEEPRNELRLVYEDDGVGISKAEKKKIFKEGYGRGTGYGLYLIKKICEVYGWTIQETGVYGKGVQFVITIPRVNGAGKESYRLS